MTARIVIRARRLVRCDRWLCSVQVVSNPGEEPDVGGPCEEDVSLLGTHRRLPANPRNLQSNLPVPSIS